MHCHCEQRLGTASSGGQILSEMVGESRSHNVQSVSVPLNNSQYSGARGCGGETSVQTLLSGDSMHPAARIAYLQLLRDHTLRHVACSQGFGATSPIHHRQCLSWTFLEPMVVTLRRSPMAVSLAKLPKLSSAPPLTLILSFEGP